MTGFSPETIAAIGGYVYALIDPRRRSSDPRRIFYVGKGVGNRCFSHARAELRWRRSSEGPNPKLALIRKIRRVSGQPPFIEIICHGLNDAEACRLEAILIKALGTDPGRRMKPDRDLACNRTSGRDASSMCLSIDEIEGLYSHPLMDFELKARVLLVNLNGGGEMVPYPEIRKRDLRRRVLRYWRVGPEKADTVDYVVGVYDKLVRTVFKVRKNRSGTAIYRRYDCGRTKSGHRKFKTGFSGEPCPEKQRLWANRRIMDSRGKTLTKFARQRGWKLVGKIRQQ